MRRHFSRMFLSLLPAAGCVIAPALSGAVVVSVSPSQYTLRAGQSKTFSASVSGATNKAVSWSVNGVAGGNATVGTITPNGVYTAPKLPPSSPAVKIRATSAASSAAYAEATVTVLNPEPFISSLSPSTVNVGALTIAVVGRGFIPTSQVSLCGRPAAATFVSETELKVAATQNDPKDCEVTVTNPDPGLACSNVKILKVLPPVSVKLSPETATVRIGATRQFYASVANASNKTVTWLVNGVKGGNAVVGTISDSGLYTPPAVLPPATGSTTVNAAPATSAAPSANAPQVQIEAVSAADPKASAKATVTLWNALPQILSATPQTLAIGKNVQVTVNGSGFARGAQLLLGSTPLTIISQTPTQIVASATPTASVGGVTTLSVRNPEPGAASSNALVLPVGPERALLSAHQAASFLERASWGPTPESIARLQELGYEGYLKEQYNAPLSDYPEPAPDSNSIDPARRAFYLNAMTGQDQLRQRVAFALSQILVVSGVKTGSSHQLVPYMRLLHRHAFGNYFTLLKEVTLNPTMGRFLDMVNNEKANPARGIEPNENYARELLQLFSIGLVELNMDGTPRRDAFGNTIPAYSEDTVKNFARALTGWTYPTKPGATPRFPNPAYYNGPMIAFEDKHDQTAKTLLLGQVIPPGRTAAEEVDAVIQNLAAHPNVAPFISLRLIQRLVMGNPTPGYVQRVASVFQATRGDLWQTVRAILLDAEAMNTPPNQGKLREPVLFILSFLRGLNATVSAEHSLNSYARNMGQDLWFAPSVFNYFSPFFRVNGVVAPEFQINTPSVALNRVNFIYRASRDGLGSAVQVDLGASGRESAGAGGCAQPGAHARHDVASDAHQHPQRAECDHGRADTG